MSLEKLHSSYISNILIKEIAEKLLPEKLLTFEVKHTGGLDGFMSALYTLTIKTLNETTKKENTHLLIAKFMKGDENFRVSSRCYIQFANEIFIYSKVIPYYEEVLRKTGEKTIKVEDWIPKVYVAKYGKIEGLSQGSETSNECVLVLEHLKPKGYALGPQYILNQAHLLAMVKPLAEYHAMTYILRVQGDQHLEKLIEGIIPLPFIEEGDTKTNFYDVLYRVAFDRFFEYFDRCKETLICKEDPVDVRFESALNRLNAKYGAHPTSLLEYIRSIRDDDDRKFAAILHGDFNRNNVMFRYENNENDPRDAKMIDFQEIRYGTPCIDLSFAMYMNLDASVREEAWTNILEYYHSNLLNTMSTVLKKCGDDKMITELESYSFDKFQKHFSKYAFYGCMICMHFMPWVCGTTEEECSRMAVLFETDLHGEEFYKLSFISGGDVANKTIYEIIKHAYKMGYLDAIC